MRSKIALSCATGSFSDEAATLYCHRESIDAELIYTIDFEVHQYLMLRPEIDQTQIKSITSHRQAMVQCERYIQHHYPNLTTFIIVKK